MTKGWRYESGRHACAARGIKTVQYSRLTKNGKITAYRGSINDISGLVRIHLGGIEQYIDISGPAYVALNIAAQRYAGDEMNENTLGDTLDHLYLMAHMSTEDWENRIILNNKIKQYSKEGKEVLNDFIFNLVIRQYPDIKHVMKDWIVVRMWNALAEGVYNLPNGWHYRVYDYDEKLPKGSKLPKLPPKTVGLYIYQGILEKVEGLPKGKSYVTVVQDE